MNKIYKVVWSKVKHCYVVTSELAKRQTKGCGARSLRMAAVSMGIAAALIGVIGSSVAEAGGTVPIGGGGSSGGGSTTSGTFPVENRTYCAENLYWNPSAKSVTVTASTIRSDGSPVTEENNAARYTIGNIVYRNSSITTHVLVNNTESAFIIDDGTLKQVFKNPGMIATLYQQHIKGYSDTNKDVSGYSVTVDMGSSGSESKDEVYGGYSLFGNATGNSVTVKSGVLSKVFGGFSYSGDATDNSVTITGGTLAFDKSVYGGYSITGAASGNEVSINAEGKEAGNVYGGYSKNSTAGGTSADAGNKVILTNGTATRLHGGVSANGSASYNTVTMNGGTVRYAIYGGEADKGKAEYNEVVITKGDFSPGNSTFYIYGGSGTTDASNNTVTIKGDANLSEKTYIYGGSAMSITVSGTNVEEVLGIAANNTVNILKPITVLGLYGGIGDETKSSGNTLNIAAKGVVANDVAAFQNMNFYLPKDIANNDTMLTIKGNEGVEPTPANLKGVSFGVAALQGVNLQKGNTVNLVVGKNGLTTDDTLKTTDSASLGSAAFLAPNNLATDTKYELSISKKDANTIIATVDNVTNTDPTPDPTPTPDPDPKPTPTPDYSNNERLKSLVETRAGVVTMINAGADMLAGQGMSNAAEAAADTRAGGGFEAFGAVSGGKLRAKSGSHVDTKGIGLNLGFARELSNKQGKLLFGPVIEYGHGSYDSYQDNGIKADGKTSYWGIGVIAKQTNHSGFYYEGSLRVGKTKSDYSSDLSPVNHASYDSKATYWAAHLGIGKVMDVGKDNTLDVYGKYFYSHTGSDNVTVHATSGDEEINFDAVNSHRLRIGTRLTHALNEKNRIYGGLAWQYEFKGDARATYNGGSTPSPSVKGSSGMMELGWQVKPGKSPMTIDLGVTGWVGKQRGITANLQANWTF